LHEFLGTINAIIREPRAKETLNLLAAGVSDFEKARDAAHQAQRELEAKRTEHKQTMEREAKEHTARLDRERAEWNAAVAKRMAEIDAMEKQAKDALEKATRDGKSAAALRKDLQERLSKLHELAA
jgi:hypothetical protein